MHPKTCLICNTANRGDASFCRNCGRSLTALPTPNQRDSGRICCNFCGNVNRARARHCARCGKPLTQSRLSPPLVLPSADKLLNCRHCGFQNREAAKHCAKCGQVLHSTSSLQKRPIPIWPVAVVLIFICIGGFTFIILRDQSIVDWSVSETTTIVVTDTPALAHLTHSSTLTTTPSPTSVILPQPTVTPPLTITSTITPLPTIRPLGKPVQGEVAPDFTLMDTRSGETVTLSDLTGQPVLITFWATWCGYCREEMPTIQDEYEKYQDDGLVILAVDVGDSRSDVLSYADQIELTFNLLLDSDSDVSELYRVQGFPTKFFVRRDSVIEMVYVGSLPAAELSQYLSRIIDS